VTLLTGGARSAEAAMLEGIRRNYECEASPQELLLACVRAAIGGGSSGSDGDDPDSWHLPVELKRVLTLPARLRHCFVLRILGGLSREECERLNLPDSDGCAGAAALELARMRESALPSI